MPRIAMAGFQHETNSLSPVVTDYGAFEMADSWPGLLSGEAVISGTRGMNLPIAGFAEAAERDGAELVPILWCAAEPAGPVCDDAFDRISADIIEGISAAGRIDGLYLDLHGAMITRSLPDGEGALLRRVRETFGEAFPIIVSLDLHANISPLMAALADVICIFRTYPHLDMAETGARAWLRLRERLIHGPLSMAFRQASFVLPLHAQHTDADPARRLYRDLPDRDGELVEMALGFSAGDTPDRVPSVIAYAQSDAAANALAETALAALEMSDTAFQTGMWSAADAVAEANAFNGAGPVVLADVQDNPGAGASSDTTGLLRALLESGATGVLLGLMHDPAMAARAHAAGVGATLSGPLGGRSGVPGDVPLKTAFVVETLSEGQCRYTGEMYRGGIATLGKSCVLRPEGSDIRIVVTSIRNQCLDLAHFTHFGLEPALARIVCVKSTAHFRADFAPIAGRILVVESPGLFPCRV